MKVEIRAWRLSDAPDLAASIGNPAVLRNLRNGIPYPYTEGDAQAFIMEMTEADPNQVFAFAITAELGYYLAEPFWGRGIATQAVRLACGYVFNHTDILRIFAEPFAYNTASCRVLEKAGFQLEGTLRSNAVKNGRVLDMKMYALVRSD